MKSLILRGCSLALALSILPFVAGCSQQPSDTPQSLVSVAQAEPAVPITATNISQPDQVTDQTNTVTGENPVAAESVTTDRQLPPNVLPSSPLAQVIKLAQAGVDESVMQAFVTNSGGTFNVSSDEIIYLSDIGVPNGVVTAMIQRDQSLKDKWAGSTPASAAAMATGSEEAQPTASAPSYENPPPAEETAQSPTDETPTAQQSPPANVNYNYFYDTLSPYGNWVNVDGYGSCWQPNVVVINPGWQPYCNRGHWIYTDCGWYWMSDYSWGWATFHYGRWFRDPRWGWCWRPDRVWAPAWVSWRYSDAYCGWAPLPPAANFGLGVGLTFNGGSVGVGFNFGLAADCYTFVPWGHVWDRRPYRYRVPRDRRMTVYNNTTVLNDIARGNNNTIINRGVPTDRVERYTGRELHPVQIRANTAWAPQGGRGERLGRDSRMIFVNRPDFEHGPHGSEPPSAVPAHPISGQNPVTVIGTGRNAQTPPNAQHSRDRNMNPQPGGSDATRRESQPPADGRRGRGGTSSMIGQDGHITAQNESGISSPAETGTEHFPRNALVIIGKRNVTTPQAQNSWKASTPGNSSRGMEDALSFASVAAPTTSVPTRAPTFNWRASRLATDGRQEIPRVSRSIQDRDNSRPAYSTPGQAQVYSQTYYAPSAESPTERPYNAHRNVVPPLPRFERSYQTAPPDDSQSARSVEAHSSRPAQMRSDSAPISPRADLVRRDSRNADRDLHDH